VGAFRITVESRSSKSSSAPPAKAIAAGPGRAASPLATAATQRVSKPAAKSTKVNPPASAAATVPAARKLVAAPARAAATEPVRGLNAAPLDDDWEEF
jgi:hypothetical protein